MPGLIGNNENAGSSEHEALQSLLSGQKESSEAADLFCQPVESQWEKTQDSSEIEPLLWQTWQALTTTAAQTSHDSTQREHLVEAVLQIQSRPNLSWNDKLCTVWDETVWQGLPILGPQLREAWNHGELIIFEVPLPDSFTKANEYKAATTASSKDEQAAWLKFNAFVATLVSALHESGKPSPDFSLFGLWTVRTALEKQESPDDVSMQAAGLWMMYAAPTIRKSCSEGKTFDGKVAKPGSLFKNESWRGFESGRWKAWESKLGSMEGDDIVQETARAMSKAWS